MNMNEEVLSDKARVAFDNWTKPSVRAPRITVSSGVCCFCKKDFNDGVLVTRKQVYICSPCMSLIDLIMETNSKIISNQDKN